MSFQHNFAQQNAFQVELAPAGASAPVGAQAIASAPSRVAQVAVFVAANLLLTTLAPIPEVRAATVQAQKITKWQPADTSRGTPAVLQVVAAAPIVPGITAGLIQTAYQPPDTSHGTPKALIPDSIAPTSSLAFIAAPIKPWQPRDTSAGMPKPLQPDATTPFATSTPSAPSALQVLANTSQGTSNELLPPAAASLPPGGSAWLPAPSSKDQRTVLIYRPDVDATVVAPPLPPGASLLLGAPSKLQVLPDGSRSAYALQFPPVVVELPPGEQQTVSAPVIRSQPTNTSLGTPVGYFPAAAAIPEGEQLTASAPPKRWQPRDTTAGTPKTLIPDDTISVQQEPTAQMSPIQRLWQPRDSSQSSFALTFPAVAAVLPPGQSSWVATPSRLAVQDDTSQSAWAAQQPVAAPIPPGQASWVATPPGQWQPGDTSRSAWVAQLPIILPPTVSPVWLPPLASNWQAPDTSRGTPKPLIPDAQAPVGEQQTATQVGPPAAVTDTSQSAWAITHPAVVVALPPGTSLLLSVPLGIPNVVNTSLGSPDTLTLPPPIPPAPVATDWGGGWRYYFLYPWDRKKKREIDQEAAKLAVQKAIADNFERDLISIDRAVKAELDRQKLKVKATQQHAFSSFLELERQRHIVAKAQAKADQEQQRIANQRARNAQLAQMIIEMDEIFDQDDSPV